MRFSSKPLAVLFSFGLVAATAIAGDADYRGRKEFEAVLEKISPLRELGPRIEAASAAFLGVPFGDGPLGEGADGKYDNDPLCRADRFDCTTYVETVAALALSGKWEEFTSRIDRIRYAKGKIDFTTRNHFIESDWIPNNARNEKILTDITEIVGEKSIRMAKTTIDKAAWFAKHNEKRFRRDDLKKEEREELLSPLKESTKDIPTVEAKLAYIPFEVLLGLSEDELADRRKGERAIRLKHVPAKEGEKLTPEQLKALRAEMAEYRKKFLADHVEKINHDLLKKIPTGTLVNMIHPDRPLKDAIGTNMIVTHQGWLIWKDRVLYLRHAAVNDKVIDVPLAEYVNVFIVPGNLDPHGVNLLSLQRP